MKFSANKHLQLILGATRLLGLLRKLTQNSLHTKDSCEVGVIGRIFWRGLKQSELRL